jgi:hypothetical protein
MDAKKRVLSGIVVAAIGGGLLFAAGAVPAETFVGCAMIVSGFLVVIGFFMVLGKRIIRKFVTGTAKLVKGAGKGLGKELSGSVKNLGV